MARRFFALPRDEKRRHLRSRDNPWGYYDRELTKERRDRKEIFDIGPDAGGMAAQASGPFAGTTPWPSEPADFAAVMQDWFGRMTRLSGQLTGLISASLTGEFSALRPAFEPDHTSFLRLNFYPVDDPLAGEAGDEADLGVHHHTDAGALTVLPVPIQGIAAALVSSISGSVTNVIGLPLVEVVAALRDAGGPQPRFAAGTPA